MGQGIRERLLVAFIALVGCGIITALTFLHRWLDPEVRAVLESTLRQEAALLAAELDRAPPADLPAWVARLPRANDERITLVAPDGRVLADNDVPADALGTLENHAGRPEVKEALRGRIGSSLRSSPTFSRDFLYVAAPVGAPPRLVVRVALHPDELERTLGRARKAVWLSGLVGLMVAVALGWLLSRRLGRSLTAMTHAARAMSHADFGALLPEPSNDEVGELVHALETLRSQLAARIEELRDEGKKLRTILNGMDEGVALIQGGAIAVANPAFGKLLGAATDDVEGRGPLEVSRLPSMAEVVEQALAGKIARREVTVGARSLLVQAHPLGPARARQAVLVLFDTTESKRLERLRRDFVANASHELRTPVAAIVGVADTLAAGASEDPEARRSFVDILSRHARRLELLTADLLNLARMEAGYKPRVESVPVDAAVEAVVSSLRARADEKRIQIEVAPAPGLLLRAERAALEQILTNFLDNAIKYTPDGGRVRVWAAAQAEKARLTVEDSGPGIDPEHLPRLWERFYRVDSARSRELGGTGLGLSIVKHLALANGGDVGVESEVGKGSRFYVELPRA